MVKLYDKIHELKVNGRCPEKLQNKSILRAEVGLKREAFLKKFDLDRKASLYKMLRKGYLEGRPVTGVHREDRQTEATDLEKCDFYSQKSSEKCVNLLL